MKAFFGGQIKTESRGNLSVVVSQNDEREGYNAFLYPVDSEEFTHLTGVGAIGNPLKRVYINVSHQAGERLVKMAQEISFYDPKKEEKFTAMDRKVVYENFLKIYLNPEEVKEAFKGLERALS